MLSQSTDTVLRAMKLTGMANELERQNADPKLIAALSFDERISLIVDAEWRKRQSSKMKRYVNDACLPIKRAQVEDIEYHPDRKLKKAQIVQLASCSYIDAGVHIIIHGASGMRQRHGLDAPDEAVKSPLGVNNGAEGGGST